MQRELLPFSRPTIDEETIQSALEVLRSGWITSGPKVLEFESALSDYLGGRTVRTVTSATTALEIALRVCGVVPGDEVITPALSFVATANSIMRIGATPVFVDVELDTRNLQLDQVAAAITPRTKAIVPVHFAGLPVDMDRLLLLASRHSLRVIEDAAHAIGSKWLGRKIGSFGDLICFSFHASKNITTIEGGAVVGASAAEITAISQHRFHGIDRQGLDHIDVVFAGGKANLSDVSAQIGLGQLRKLDVFNDRRRLLVARYFERWHASAPIQLPARGDDGHSWHLFAPLLPLGRLTISRQEFIQQMEQRGVAVGVHYPAIHLFSAYQAIGYREGQFPIAEQIGRETVTLPLFPSMDISDVDLVVDAVDDLLSQHID